MKEPDTNWQRALISSKATLAEAIANLNTVGIKLALCVDAEGRLVGAVTDGDLRRGLLRGLSMKDPVCKIANTNPLVVPKEAKIEVVRAIMQFNNVLQVPIVDAGGRIIGLHLHDALNTVPRHDHAMVIAAGGAGTRLRPYTENCPKPMLRIAGKPILQHIIERAKSQGFGCFILSLNYLGQMIRDYFGDGSANGVQISYIDENEPLGTAGALSLLQPRPNKTFVVTNGDVLADVDYRELIDFSEQHSADAVMAVRIYELTNPYGVVQMDGVDITGITEKPVSYSYINAGIYAFTPTVLDNLKQNYRCDIPTLFNRLRKKGLRTVAFPMHEPWLDVGRPDDLERAKQKFCPKPITNFTD